MSAKQIGAKHHKWKGGIRKDINGYVMIYVGNNKYVSEHRLVMERKLGRKLLPDEIVHHINETFEGRSNNSVSNLQLTNRSDHLSHHMIGNTNSIGKGKRYTVYFHKLRQKWCLQINEIGKRRYGAGLYKTKEEAIRVAEQIMIVGRKEGIM